MENPILERLEHHCAESMRATGSLTKKNNKDNYKALVLACINSIKRKKIIAVAGNGGSHADSIHLAAELVNQFTFEHDGFPVMALGANAAILTSWANDRSFESQLSREFSAFKDQIGLLICLTTSGKSKNIIELIKTAKRYKIPVGILSSEKATQYLPKSEYLLLVDSEDTPNIQESHLILYHSLCREIEFQLSTKKLIKK